MTDSGDNSNNRPDDPTSHWPIRPAASVLAKEVLTQIESHPESWYQDDWVTAFDQATRRRQASRLSYYQIPFNQEALNHCQTAYCVAGWAATLAGGIWHEGHLEAEVDDPATYADGDFVTVRNRAQRLLDLTDWEAKTLFNANNNYQAVVTFLRQLADGKPLSLSES